MRRQKLLTTVTLCCALGATVNAEPWQTNDARSLGMGGAQVAAPEGASGLLTNPASLALDRRWDVALPLSIDLRVEGDVIDEADQLLDQYDTQGIDDALTRLNSGTSVDPTGDVASVLEFFTQDAAVLKGHDDEGIRVSAQGLFAVKVGKFSIGASTRFISGVGIRYDSDFSNFSAPDGSSIINPGAVDSTTIATSGTPGADAIRIAGEADAAVTGAYVGGQAALVAGQVQTLIDEVATVAGVPVALLDVSDGTELDEMLTGASTAINQSNIAGAAVATSIVLDNDTGVKIRTLWTKELALGYGHSFMDKRLHIGGAIKIIQGETREVLIRLADGTNPDIEKEMKEDSGAESSTQLGLDLGALFEVTDRFSVGLVGKDLTSPSFNVKNGEDIELKPQLRTGVSFVTIKKKGWGGRWAADLDLTNNKSTVLGSTRSRELALGYHQELMGWLSLRVGATKDLEAISDAVAYSAGVGLQLGYFYLDVAARKSSDDIRIDNDDYPSRGAVALGWNMNF